MRSRAEFLTPIMSAVLICLSASICFGATVTGTVAGPDGSPFQGAFVEAQNTKNKITTIVLSNKQGQYRIENLGAGEYRVQIRAVGYRTDPETGVDLDA